MDDIQYWSKPNNYWKRPSVRMPFWLIHFFDYVEFIIGWILGKLFDLAYEALRSRFPWLIRWRRKSQQYQDIVLRLVVAEEINAAEKINAEVSHASSSHSP
jgi:hypothetical protein